MIFIKYSVAFIFVAANIGPVVALRLPGVSITPDIYHKNRAEHYDNLANSYLKEAQLAGLRLREDGSIMRNGGM